MNIEYCWFVYYIYPFVIRGGNDYRGIGGGIFLFTNEHGFISVWDSFRVWFVSHGGPWFYRGVHLVRGGGTGGFAFDAFFGSLTIGSSFRGGLSIVI